MNERDESWRRESEHGRGVTNEWEAARGYGGGGPRGYWRERPSWQQDPYGFGQRTPRRDPYQDRPDPYEFEREPFRRREDVHYYGTGSAGWGGPGFTGGAYAYGDSSRYQNQPLEGEYSDESAMSYEDQLQRDSRGERRTRRYPPGPKGYQRSDERLKEDISERLYGAYHIDSSEVTVNVMGGKATLEGVVPSRHMKHAIEDMVDACPGVTEIDNRIRITRAQE